MAKIRSKKQQLQSLAWFKKTRKPTSDRQLVADWMNIDYEEANWYDMELYQEEVSEYAFHHIMIR